ncbi:hypothetical protein HALDL1_03675 [Halobacterium sp. DL1]|nr:hypothetical protein HALDL1_03675 [Halobacterium sp. DL1]
MSDTDHLVLLVGSIQPYCTFSISRDERDTLLRHVTREMDKQRSDPTRDSIAPWLENLRPVIEESVSTLRLDMSDHANLSTLLTQVMDSEGLLERFREATPQCYWCGDSADRQIDFHDYYLVLACSECLETIDSSDGHHLLQDLDPTISPSTTIDCLDASTHQGTNEQQSTLLQFTTSD